MIAAIETIEIYNPIGGSYGIFPVTDKCERHSNLMGEESVKLEFSLETRCQFEAFSFIVYDGMHYFLREKYRPTPKGSHYEYAMTFVSVSNMLAKSLFMRYYQVPLDESESESDEEYRNIQPEPEVNINANLSDMMEIVIRSIHGASERVPQFTAVGVSRTKTTYALMLEALELDTETMLPGTELKTFSYESNNIAEVLNDITEQYDTEWWITESAGSLTLHICKCEQLSTPAVLSDTFKYHDGDLKPYRSRGLLSCNYANEWSDIPQRILPYGSDRNIVRKQALDKLNDKDVYVSYGKRLRLQPNHTYYVKDKECNSVTITTDEFGAVENTGVTSGIEKTETFDDIYPQGHFVVTKCELSSNGAYYTIEAQAVIQDTDGSPMRDQSGRAMLYEDEEAGWMENHHIVPIMNKEQTEDLSIIFESGYLNGREFGVSRNQSARDANGHLIVSLDIVPDGNEDEALELPNASFHPIARDNSYEGDMFAIFNMDMPDGYIDMAEQRLAQATYDKLIEYQNSRPDVKCQSEPEYFGNYYNTGGISMSLGKRFSVFSELFGEVAYVNDDPNGEIDESRSTVFTSRVTAFSHSLTSPDNVEFTLASGRVEGKLAAMESMISDQSSNLRGLEQKHINLSKRGWHDAEQISQMLNSVTSEVMLAGNPKYQFAYNFDIEVINSGRVIDNVSHTAKVVIEGGGCIQHTQKPYIDYPNQGLWFVDGGGIEFNMNNFTDSVPYYLYAIVGDNKTTLGANDFVLLPERNEGTDYMLLGILSSEFYDNMTDPQHPTSYRMFNGTTGYTMVAGGKITTEQIQDAGRRLIIDFSSNPPRIIAQGGAQIIGNISFMSTQGDIVPLNTTIANMQNQIDGSITSWFLSGVPTLSNAPANGWDTVEEKEEHLGDLYYDNDTGYCYRFYKEGNTYGWMKIVDNDVVLALQEAAKNHGVRNYFAKRFIEDWNSVAPTNLFPKAKIKDDWTTGVVVNGVRQYEYDLSKCIFNSLRTSNTSANSNYFAVRRMVDASTPYTPSGSSERFVYMNALGQFSGQFTKTSDWHYLQLYFNGNVTDARMAIDAEDLFKDGHAYYITGKVTMLDRSGSGNLGRVEQIYIYDAAEYSGAAYSGGVFYKDEFITKVDTDDQYGESYSIREDRLYHTIGGGGSENDILQGKVSFEANKRYVLKVKWRKTSVGSYNGLYLGFKYSDNTKSHIECPKDQLTPLTQFLVSDEGKTITGIYCTFGSWNETRIYDISLTEGARVPEGWIKADEDILTGSENMANHYTASLACMEKVGNGFRATAADTKNYLQLCIDTYNSKQTAYDTYVREDSPSIGWHQYKFRLKKATKYFRIKHNGNQDGCDIVSSFALDEYIAEGTQVVISFELVNRTQGYFEWKNVMIQVGNRATKYIDYYTYLSQAFENAAIAGSTDINGGLLATSLIKLRNENGEVTAGMSGLNDHKKKISGSTLVSENNSHGVTLWGGGTYAQALAAAAGGGRIPILLTKDGIQSMIGVFTILEDKAIIKTNNGTIVMDDDEGISVLDSQGLERVLVTPTTINEHVPTTHEITNFLAHEEQNYTAPTTEEPDPQNSKSGTYTHEGSFEAERTDDVHIKMNIPVILLGASVYSQAGFYVAVAETTISNLKIVVTDNATSSIVHTETLISSSGVKAPIISSSGTSAEAEYNHTFSPDFTFRVIKGKTYKVRITFDYEMYNGNSSGHSVQPTTFTIGEGNSQSTTIKIRYTSMCAYLCSDGLAVMANSDTQFKVEATDDNKLGIYAKGLPTSEPDVTGQLYIKNVSGSKVIAIK